MDALGKMRSRIVAFANISPTRTPLGGICVLGVAAASAPSVFSGDQGSDHHVLDLAPAVGDSEHTLPRVFGMHLTDVSKEVRFVHK